MTNLINYNFLRHLVDTNQESALFQELKHDFP